LDTLATLGLLLGTSWATGINLYASVFVLGLADRLGWIALPDKLEPLSAPPVLATAGLLYLFEFVADKIPGFDSLWDSIHTFIRPLGGAALAYLAVGADANPTFQVIAVLLGGTIALDSHLTKSTSRLLINTSPEPFSNWAASLLGDGLVVGLVLLAVSHPLATVIIVLLLILFSLWFLSRMIRLAWSVLPWRRRRQDQVSAQ
jgi:hypothetical protein